MKRNLLNSFCKSILCLLVALMTGGSAWAATHTLRWGNGTSNTNTSYFTATSGTVNGIVSFTTAQNSAGTAPAYSGNNNNNRSLRLYYASNGDGCSITLTPAEDIRITGVELTALQNYTPNVSYTVDGGSAQPLSRSGTTYTANNLSASSSLKIQNVNTSNTQLRISSIQITYVINSGVETTTTIDATSITNTNVNVSVPAGSLSATVSANGAVVPNASVTWSSDNESVATIDANTGEVTLITNGTVNFTATYAGVWNQYKISRATYTMTVTGSNPSHTLWTEDFTGRAANSTPATCTTDEAISYAYTGTTSVQNNNYADGTRPELRITSGGGEFAATVPLHLISGDLTLTFKSNANQITVSTTTTGVRIPGTSSFNTSGTHTVTFTDITPEMTSITIVFTNSNNGNNVRIDDINMTGYAAPLEVEAPTFSIAEGDYYTAQSVELSCATEGATIYYSTDNENWTKYTAAISVAGTTTLYAKAEKADYYGTLFTSGVSSAAYTILPKNSVVFITEKSIPYGTPYTLTTGTSDGVDVKTDGTVTASNSANTAIATVSGLTITPVAVGTTTITVAAEEGDTYLAGPETTITVNVTAPEGLATGAPSTPETYAIPASGIGTYCSQYPIDLTKLPAGVVPYTVKENTGSLIRMKEITDPNIKGGVGVIYKGEPRTVITFSYANSENDPTENGLLVGTLAPTYLAEGTAYGLKSGVFYPNTAGTINANRAYVPAEGNAVKALKLEFEEEDPTGIENLNGNLNDEVIYNVAGQRINKIQKGVNIVNGKKILK